VVELRRDALAMAKEKKNKVKGSEEVLERNGP
jgi:hypothetical protein